MTTAFLSGGVRGTGWLAAGRRLAAGVHGLWLAAVLLGVAALAEATGRARAGDADWAFTIVLGMLSLATALPLALPPVPAAVAVSATSLVSLVPFQSPTVAGAAALALALHRLGRAGAALLAAGLAIPFVVVAAVAAARGEGTVLTVLLASAAPAAAASGVARRALDEAVVHRRARQVIAANLLDHTARGERARIARELHDVVAHHISMVVVQAESARLTTPGMPPAGADRLMEIRDTARAGLTEMRRLLGVLREDAGSDAAERRPQPGLQQLGELIDEARATSGATTRLIVSGAPIKLDAGVELAAYRIVQEALTNARRHAPGAAVDVELHYVRDALRLRVRDNGPGPGPGAAAGGGHGLPGMQERAAAVGGWVRTGPAAAGGFLLEASLPAGTGATP